MTTATDNGALSLEASDIQEQAKSKPAGSVWLSRLEKYASAILVLAIVLAAVLFWDSSAMFFGGASLAGEWMSQAAYQAMVMSALVLAIGMSIGAAFLIGIYGLNSLTGSQSASSDHHNGAGEAKSLVLSANLRTLL